MEAWLFYRHLYFYGLGTGFDGDRRGALLYAFDLTGLADGRDLLVGGSVGDFLVTVLRSDFGLQAVGLALLYGHFFRDGNAGRLCLRDSDGHDCLFTAGFDLDLCGASLLCGDDASLRDSHYLLI